MKNANQPAAPLSVTDAQLALLTANGAQVDIAGLTKREYFAGLAMQALAGSAAEYTRFSEMAADAVVIADALLAELERTK